MSKCHYTDQQIIDSVKVSFSIAQVCRACGLKTTGSNYKTIKFKIKKLGLDTSHFTGQLWSKGLRVKGIVKIPSSEYFSKDTLRATDSLKKRAIKEGYLQSICSVCGIVDWNNKPLSLQIDHINSDKYDNRVENLRILCPNCHSQTDGFAGKGKKKYTTVAKLVSAADSKSAGTVETGLVGSTPTCRTNYCIDCQKRISKTATRCKHCTQLDTDSKINWPPNEELLIKLETTSYVKLSKELNVSDNAIRKHLKRRGIVPPKSRTKR